MGELLSRLKDINWNKIFANLRENFEPITISIFVIAIIIFVNEIGLLDCNETNKWAYLLFLFFILCAFPILVGLYANWLEKHSKNALTFLATLSVFFAFYSILFNPEDHFEILRLLVLILGGLGAFYGLIIASRRQDRFEKQTNYAQRQVFNDQLGRAVEMLANQDQTSIRMAGIRIMQELGKSSNQKRKQLVKNILVDFIHEKASLDNPEPYPYKREIELAVIAVTSIQTSGYVSFQKLRLNDLQFRHCIFNDIHFLFCQIKKTHFYKTTFETCRFYECDLTKARFSRSTFKNIVDFTVDLTNTDFRYIEGLQPNDFENAYFEENKHPIIFLDNNKNSFGLKQQNEFVWREFNHKIQRHTKTVGGAANTYIPMDWD